MFLGSLFEWICFRTVEARSLARVQRVIVLADQSVVVNVHWCAATAVAHLLQIILPAADFRSSFFGRRPFVDLNKGEKGVSRVGGLEYSLL